MELTIAKRPLDKQAADVLRQQIVSGVFPPGFRLVETWLSKETGLSRGTIRAALNELAHQGLVTQVAYTKWMVAEVSPDIAWEVFTLRSVLEGLGARLAAQRIDEGSREQINGAYQDLVAAVTEGDAAKVTEADFALHKLIVSLARHSRLSSHYDLIEQQVRVLIASSNALLTGIGSIIDQHQPIVEAIRQKRAGTAERLMRSHVESEGKILWAHLSHSDAETGGARSGSGEGANGLSGRLRVAERRLPEA